MSDAAIPPGPGWNLAIFQKMDCPEHEIEVWREGWTENRAWLSLPPETNIVGLWWRRAVWLAHDLPNADDPDKIVDNDQRG